MIYIFSPRIDGAKTAVLNKIACEDYATGKFYIRTARASAILATEKISELKLLLLILKV